MTARESTFDYNHEVLTGALLSSVRNRSALEAAGSTDDIRLINVVQFSLLFNFDLSCLLRDLRARKGTWHVKLHARNLALTMFECVDDFLALLGKDFRALVARTANAGAALATLNHLHSQLRVFQDQHRDFGPIRHSITAHREHNAAAQIQLLQNLDDAAIESAAWAMIQWLSDLHAFTTSLNNARTLK